MSSYLSKLVYPISKNNIIQCTKFVCVCVEYLDITNKQHFEKYKHCMITNIINKEPISSQFDMDNYKKNL